MWNQSGPNPSDAAWRQPKDGLAYAFIEGKHRITKEIRLFAQCDGFDFCNFEWIGAASSPGVIKQGIKLATFVVGLSMVTRNARLIVMRNGQMRVDRRIDPDTFYHFGRV
jgi:hypothetical protein